MYSNALIQKKVAEMKKNNSFLLLLTLCVIFNAHSMDRDKFLAGWATLVGSVILGTAVLKQLWQTPPLEPSAPFAFSGLPQDMQNKIIEFLSIYSTAESLSGATRMINSLAQVNTELNAKINDPAFCLQIIKHLSRKFNCSDMDVCLALQTHAAKQLLVLQQQLYNLCTNTEMSLYDLQEHLIDICVKGVDLEFTYTITMKDVILHQDHIVYATPLMIASMESYQAILPLLSQGVNINATDKNGTTALMFAAKTRNVGAAQELCKYRKFLDINKQDEYGNTALLYSLFQSPYHFAHVTFIGISQAILDAGADPELANNDGVTPLQVAQKIHHQKAIRIITQAIDKKYARPE